MREVKLDKRDLQILALLMENSRASSRELARRLGLSTGTIQARINRLENIGVIKRYTVDLDLEELGYQFPVLIDIKVSKGRMRYIEEILSKMDNVSAVYDITGEYDITIIARFRTRERLDSFIKHLQELEYIERTNTKLILNVISENRRRGYIEEILRNLKP
jgi:DNA-binding Lrp family transcriptional regulator